MSRSQIGVLIVLSLLVCAVGLVAAGLLVRLSQPTEVPMAITQTIETVITDKGSFAVPGPAFLDGRDPDADPPLTIMSINVWDAVPRRSVVCALAHGTRVQLIEARYHEPEERYYFLIEAGDCRGWLPEPFIGDTYHEPIGDPF